MKIKFNIPNKISIIRIALVPLFAAILLLEAGNKYLYGGIVFIILSISDFLDGYFARKKRQITEFGKLIDPIADKLLISTALIFLIGRGVDLWMCMVVIAREIIATAIRIYLLPGKIIVPSSIFGKAKTVVQSIAIAFTLLKLPFSYYLMLAAVLLTVVSGIEYLFRVRQMTKNRIVNLPNLITLTRFLLIIPFGYYMLKSNKNISLIIFAVITLSDKLDGISAKIMNQKTELGSGLDSFTDWTLIIVTFIVFVFKRYISVQWFALFIMPSLISGIMKLSYAKKRKTVPVTAIARLNVVFAYTTIISIFMRFQYRDYLLLATVLLSYLSMAAYIYKNET